MGGVGVYHIHILTHIQLQGLNGRGDPGLDILGLPYLDGACKHTALEIKFQIFTGFHENLGACGSDGVLTVMAVLEVQGFHHLDLLVAQCAFNVAFVGDAMFFDIGVL